MSITTIICEGCGAILRTGDPDSGREYKKCPRCVVKSYTSPPLIGTTADGRTRFAVEDELEQLKKRISKIEVELPYEIIEGELCLVIEMKDRAGNLFAKFGLPEAKLREIADDLAALKKAEV